MTLRPSSIRDVPWALVRDRDARRHVYRRSAAAAMEQLAEAQARMLRDATGFDYRERHGDEIAPLPLALSETGQ